MSNTYPTIKGASPKIGSKMVGGYPSIKGAEPSIGTAKRTLSAEDLGEKKVLKREPDILPKGSFSEKELPQPLLYVADRLEKNPKLTENILNLMRMVIRKLGSETHDFNLFIDMVPAPTKLPNELFKILGIDFNTALRSFLQIGFSEENIMHKDPYYISLGIVYWYGCKTNNVFLRQASLMLMLVKLYRGRRTKWWPNGFDRVTVEHVQNNVIRSNTIVRKYPNTFEAILNYWAPAIDQKYWELVRDHPAHHKRGIYSILTASWTRIEQMHKNLADHYYIAFKAGIKTVSSNTQDVDERRVLGQVPAQASNIYKMMSLTNKPIPKDDIAYIKQELGISPTIVDDFNKFIKDSENDREIKEIIESLLYIMKIDKPDEIAQFNIVLSAKKITEKNFPDHLKLRGLIDNNLKYMYGKDILGSSESKKSKLRRGYILLYLLKIKQYKVNAPRYFERTTF